MADFAAAHLLRGYQGDCARLHGHNWQIEVFVEAAKLDKLGIAVDFRDIKNHTKSVISKLDHRYLNEIKPFDVLNPSAENIARYCFDEIGKLLNNKTAKVVRVVISETPHYSVSYEEQK